MIFVEICPILLSKRLFYFGGKYADCNFTETYLPQINGVVTHIKILKEGLEALGHTVLIVTADSKAHTHYLKDNVLHCPAHNLKRIYNLDLASPVSRTRLKYLRNFVPTSSMSTTSLPLTQRYGNRQNPQGAAGVHPAHHVR